MSSNPLVPSFRKLHVIPSDAAHPSVVQAVRDHDKSITDINQAITSLKSQITANTNAISSVTSTTEEVVTEEIEVSDWPGLGTVNNQSGAASYTTAQSDDGALLLFSDASPVAVTLNAVVTTPWFCFVQNWGAGLITFTPLSGTINFIGNLSAASMTLATGYSALIVFDGADFWAETLPIVPASFSPVAGEYLTGYNAVTGEFSAAAVPFATDSTAGIVYPDNVTIGVDAADGEIYALVTVGSGPPSGAPSTPGNALYFDSTASPWQAYVYANSAWNEFA